MVEKVKAVIVDTYAIMADFNGEMPDKAVKYMDMIRLGRIKGYLHYLIVYEMAYHWRKGRLPFENSDEFRNFIDLYFEILPIDVEVALEASRVENVGDKMLQEAKLKGRTLSVADATSIALALMYEVPIITGDIDLSYVARKLGIAILWR